MSHTEASRSCALHEAAILNTPPTSEFNALVDLARKLFDMPIALVSLVDKDRQWFKARSGLDILEAPRAQSFCGHVVEVNVPLIVEDAKRDRRFSRNFMTAGSISVRFYAGAPLIDSGNCYGSFCVLDTKPRQFSEESIEQLQHLATVVVGLIREHRQKNNLRKQQRELERTQARFEQTERTAKVGGFEMDLLTGNIVWSDQVYRTVGLPIGIRMTSERVSGVDKEYRILTPEGEERWVHVVSDIERQDGKPCRLFGIFQDVSDKVQYGVRSPELADLYFHEIGFRWSQRVVTGQAVRKSRRGRESKKILWSRVPPALQLMQVFRAATGRQMRRSHSGGITIKSAVAVFG